MRLCPNCGQTDSTYTRVRCDGCGADLLPDHISQEIINLRSLVNEYKSAFEEATANNTEASDLLEQTRAELKQAKDEFEARTTDEAIGRAMRRLGGIEDDTVKDIEHEIDADLPSKTGTRQRPASEKNDKNDDDAIPF